MQSSTAVVFRAMVMLACLVAIPLAAVVGKSLPDMIMGLVDGQWLGRPVSTYESFGEAPRFQAATPADPSSDVLPQPTGGDRQQVQQQPGKPASSVISEPIRSGVIAAGYETPVGRASGSAVSAGPSGGVFQAERGGAQPAASRGVYGPGGLSAIGPDWPQTSAAEPYGAPHQAPGPSKPAARAGGADGQFSYVQGRLRQLGATYYLLESWGSREQLYRFYCKVAVGGNPNYTHYFEATDSDPLRAMARVLGQVETWRGSRPIGRTKQ
jgi:hypothetical protein